MEDGLKETGDPVERDGGAPANVSAKMDALMETLEAVSRKIDGLERRRRVEDALDERVRTIEARRARDMRRAVVAVAALSAVVTALVNVALHYLWG
jgi:Flp pilus assembly protein TadB